MVRPFDRVSGLISNAERDTPDDDFLDDEILEDDEDDEIFEDDEDDEDDEDGPYDTADPFGVDDADGDGTDDEADLLSRQQAAPLCLCAVIALVFLSPALSQAMPLYVPALLVAPVAVRLFSLIR